jgi:hypothetical protein
MEMERLNLKKPKIMEGKEKYKAKISYRFTALGNYDGNLDINRQWGSVTQNIKISTKDTLSYKLKQHKLRFDRGCSKIIYQSKQAKLQL